MAKSADENLQPVSSVTKRGHRQSMGQRVFFVV